MKMLIFLFVSLSSLGQTTQKDLEQMVLLAATEMSDHFLKGDYEKFLEFLPPEAISVLGDKEKILEKLQAEKEIISAEILRISYGKPTDFYRKRGTIQCIIPQILTLNFDNKRRLGKATILGISRDEGKNWYFMDISNKSFEEVRSSIPYLHKKVLPKK